jgi:multidrug efflux system outer membrane protein
MKFQVPSGPLPRSLAVFLKSGLFTVRRKRFSTAHFSRAVLFSGLLAIAGCAVGPKYERPAATPSGKMPAAFSEQTATNIGDWKSGEPAAHLPRGEWWSLFHDPELDALEKRGGLANQELAEAIAHFEQARAAVTITRSALFPRLSLDPGIKRERTSANTGDRGVASQSRTFNNFNLSLDATWEPDLWGRVRRQTEAAKGRLEASRDELEAVKLSIQAEIASDYFSLRSVELEKDLVARTVEGYRRSLELTENRRRAGTVSDLDVSQARTQMNGAEALLPSLELRRVKLRHALATLCGEPASSFSLSTPGVFTTNFPEYGAGLPSELLERRPDVAAAERRMAAANAEVGVAQTAFYPRIVFHGLAGFQSLDAATWFSWPSRVWALGPSLELPLFTGGRNRAELAFAKSGYQAAVAAYRLTALTAFQEVEDQLAAQRLLAEEMAARDQALISARRTMEIAQNRYKAGLVTFLEVAVAENAALDHERELARLRAERLNATVALIKAVGGGFAL